jgi:hypothetical protein
LFANVDPRWWCGGTSGAARPCSSTCCCCCCCYLRLDGTSLCLFCLLLLVPLSERLRRLKQLDHQLGVELIRDLLLEVGLFVRCPSEPI